MPVFDEPLPEVPGPRFANTQPEPDPFAGSPSTVSTVVAAFRQANPIVSVIDSFRGMPGNVYDPTHDPRDILKGTPHEDDDFSLYAGSPNEAFTRSIMARKDREDANRRTLAASGAAGTAALLAAELFNPFNLLPFMGVTKGVVATAAKFAATGAAAGAGSEAALQASQVSRSWQESADNIASSTIWTGILGGAIGAWSKKELTAAVSALDTARPKVDAATGDFAPGYDSSSGAAQVDTRKLEPIGLMGLEKVPGFVTGPLAGPTVKIMFADSVEARRAAAGLAETTLKFKEDGSNFVQQPLESMKRVMETKYKTDTIKIMDEEWLKHYYPEGQPGKIKGEIAKDFARTQDGRLSEDDFNTEVFRAMNQGDVHPIPEVQAAAQRMRRDVADPFQKYLQGIKDQDGNALLSAEMEAPGGAKSYAPWRLNHEALEANRTNAVNIVADHFEGEQAIKAAAKDRLTALSSTHDELTAQIESLEGKLKTQREKQAEVAVRIEERMTGGAAADRRAQALAARGVEQGRSQVILEAAIRNAKDDLAKVRSKIEDEIDNWKGNSSAEARAALKARSEAERVRNLKKEGGVYEGRDGRLTVADAAVDRAVKNIVASHRDLSRQELIGRANEFLDRWRGSPDGRLPYDDASHADATGRGGSNNPLGGSLRKRKIAIPFEKLMDAGLLKTDIGEIWASMFNRTIPEAMLTERYGDVEMTSVFRKINEEYHEKIAQAATNKAREKLQKQWDASVKNVAALRDRLRGIYGWDPKSATYNNAVQNVRNLTMMSSLGSSMPNSINDLGANAIARYGFNTVFHDIWMPAFKVLTDPSIMKMSKREALEIGIGADTILGTARHDIMDGVIAGNTGGKFTRGTQWLANRFMVLNGLAPWTGYAKALAWNAAQGEFGRAAKRVADGAPAARDLERFRDSNISLEMAVRISKQYEAHPLIHGNSKLAHVAAWTDRGAREAFSAAMSREADIVVITPGIGSSPTWMSSNQGRLIGMFKGFTSAAHEKVLLSSLQQRDGRAVMGVLVHTMMGMLSYALYSAYTGVKPSSNPSDWIKEGVDRANITGWFSEVNKFTSKATSGFLDYNRLIGAPGPVSRRSDNSAFGDLLGPVASKAEGLGGALAHLTGAAGHAAFGIGPDKQFTAADLHKLRLVTIAQNHFMFRKMLDEIGDSTEGFLGMAPMKKAGAARGFEP